MDRHHSQRVARVGRPLVRCFVGAVALEARQFVDEARQARIASGVDRQCEFNEGIEIGLDLRMQCSGCNCCVAAPHIAFVIDAVEQVMHRHHAGEIEPPLQQLARAQQRG
jgi:hypothetical protein